MTKLGASNARCLQLWHPFYVPGPAVLTAYMLSPAILYRMALHKGCLSLWLGSNT